MLECQKHLFYLPAGLHYLNCAYMSPLLRRAEAAGIQGMRRKRAPTRITPPDFFQDAERARALFARLIHAPQPERVAVIPAASYGVATVARNTPLRAGQNIVLADDQFPSNVYAWRMLCRRQGAELRTVAAPAAVAPAGGQQTPRGAEWNARLLEAIDGGTAIVAIDHVHWTDGTRFDLESIGARARECGAAFLVDGTQTLGALPFDFQRIRPDAVLCAAYKWLLGPYSIGLAYYGPRYDAGTPLEETWLSRVGSEDFRGLVNYRDQYRPGAARYDVGESSNFILLPMLLAGLEQVLEWGAEQVQDYCRELAGELIEDARARGFQVEDEAWRAAHLFGLRAPAAFDMRRFQAALQRRRVAVSLRGSAIRVSPHLYNDASDLAALQQALHQAS